MRVQADERPRDLLADLGRRRAEIVRAVLARVHSIGRRERDPDPDYLEGLRHAVEAAIDHWIEASGRDQDLPLSVPEPLLAQARFAARRRVPLETVLRRYLAGHAVLGDFLVEEAVRLGVAPAVLRDILRSSAAETDRILAAIGSAYVAELDSPPRPARGSRQAELVRRLLDGELVDPASLEYPFDNIHVGLVVRDADRGDVATCLSSQLDAARLWVDGDDGVIWAWIGSHDPPEPDRIIATIAAALPAGSRIGIGEPALGRAGWRLTHEQARAALSVADRGSERVVRYADVALLAGTIKDELLMTSLKELYLDRLEDDRGDAGVLRETLQAFFAADRSVSSAAAALGVTRNTVTNRLRTVESRVGHLNPTRTAHLALALQVKDLGQSKRPM